ncbi:MAG: tRNA (N(6)-L-threonylcarbamoyladenosine(37)-C(2))-methylthiotransferase MtaB [Youngiibacter sp.]|nr:tRNA (N(6)-L-threonylcarbamoyladenosine(37)-C(2))-methylthiotransferase MtaB [Youngiibacter sp.]
MRVAVETLGCRVNTYDSEAMMELFERDGFEVVDFGDKADVYVINTCTVTNMGDKKSRQHIHRAKRQNPDAVVAVVGCYSQVNKEEVASIEGVDVVLGSRNKSEIVFYVNKAIAEKKQVVHVSENIMMGARFEELSIKGYEGKTRAFMKIQDGCNRFCSYCIIPYARGGVSSREPARVIEEIRLLAAEGFKEIILSGIHIASYGQDFKEGYGLIDLLEELDGIEGIERIRIGSIEPMFFKGEAMERVLSLRKLCPHFHLSLQSGSDATLKRMNRRYTSEEYLEVVLKLRDRLPDVSITTDVIVGFPQETDEEFKETMDFLEKVKLDKIHTFKYSERKGTPAAKMNGKVEPRIKDERSNMVIKLSDIFEEHDVSGIVGKKVKVLFEEGKDGVYYGYTPEYIRVRTESKQDLEGLIRTVLITGSVKGTAFGELEDE